MPLAYEVRRQNENQGQVLSETQDTPCSLYFLNIQQSQYWQYNSHDSSAIHCVEETDAEWIILRELIDNDDEFIDFEEETQREVTA